MSKNTSISLGNFFDEFIKSRIIAGRYKNASEVIRAGLIKAYLAFELEGIYFFTGKLPIIK